METFNRLDAAEIIYKTAMQNLSLSIQSKYGSYPKFAKLVGVDDKNLIKAFNGTNGKELGLATYIKIAEFLGLMPSTPAENPIKNINVTLRDYLVIDNNALHLSLHLLDKI